MIAEKVNFLTNITDQEWGQYAFSRDPLNRKVAENEKQELIEKAIECGKQQAVQVRQNYPVHSVKEIAAGMNTKISVKDSYGIENYIMFAVFNSPNSITLFKDNIDHVNKWIQEHQLEHLLNHVDVEALLIAHELFHFIEEHNADIFTKSAKITLWKLGKFQYKSQLSAVSEIAAMQFAKELLGLGFNPFVFDVLMLFPHHEGTANQLFSEITTITRS
ncbi:hypothetical protein D1B31_14195 [Neobacillus notoginsengisoli]|uniref:Uncharacterized protein n=1 Tax=Neobacillus notoginsengisoli TaxID=1578198 RepID=A0A417YT04_9BACI|nr:hypothetical protein [Neobacillus notoginsengisoli]RHW39103.1 hypothetical protein D1B31_14195 [Neobacillus notoginsengisoli]